MTTATGRNKPARAQPKKSEKKRRPRARPWHFTESDLATIHPEDPARAFCASVAATPAAHNRWAHLACKRHAIDLRLSSGQSHPYIYDLNAAQRVIAFASEFRGLKGYRAGKPLSLDPWQCFTAATIFGWRMRDDPMKRRFRYAFVKVPRKNGKTGFVAPLVLYQLSNPVGSCEIYSVATKEDIARTVLKDCISLIRTAPRWANVFRPRHKTLTHEPTSSELRPLGSDSNTLDGLRPELVVMDELHAWKDRGLWDVMNSAFGSAYSPLMLQITTEGKDPCGLLKEQEDRLCAVLQSVEAGTYTGTNFDPATADQGAYAGCLWQPDKGDRWDDPKTWYKANPSLGTVKDFAEMRSLASGARSSPGARRDFMIKQLNVRQQAGFTQWLDQELWDRCHVPLKPNHSSSWDALKGLPCWFGLDPSSRQDITSLCGIAADPNDPEVILVAWDFWVPGEDLPTRVASEGLPYDLWSREEWVNITDGNAIDINRIKERCITRRAEVDLQLMGFDEGSSQGIGVSLLNDHEFPVHAVQQGYRLGPALQEIERLVLKGNLRHFGNPVAASQFARSAIVQGDSQIRLVKAKSKGRIDGIAALAMAVAARQQSLSTPNQGAGCIMV